MREKRRTEQCHPHSLEGSSMWACAGSCTALVWSPWWSAGHQKTVDHRSRIKLEPQVMHPVIHKVKWFDVLAHKEQDALFSLPATPLSWHQVDWASAQVLLHNGTQSTVSGSQPHSQTNMWTRNVPGHNYPTTKTSLWKKVRYLTVCVWLHGTNIHVHFSCLLSKFLLNHQLTS